jgi:hypothetical protein
MHYEIAHQHQLSASVNQDQATSSKRSSVTTSDSIGARTKGNYAECAIPSLLTFWIMQNNKATNSQFFIVTINGFNG